MSVCVWLSWAALRLWGYPAISSFLKISLLPFFVILVLKKTEKVIVFCLKFQVLAHSNKYDTVAHLTLCLTKIIKTQTHTKLYVRAIEFEAITQFYFSFKVKHIWMKFRIYRELSSAYKDGNRCTVCCVRVCVTLFPPSAVQGSSGWLRFLSAATSSPYWYTNQYSRILRFSHPKQKFCLSFILKIQNVFH